MGLAGTKGFVKHAVKQQRVQRGVMGTAKSQGQRFSNYIPMNPGIPQKLVRHSLMRKSVVGINILKTQVFLSANLPL